MKSLQYAPLIKIVPNDHIFFFSEAKNISMSLGYKWLLNSLKWMNPLGLKEHNPSPETGAKKLLTDLTNNKNFIKTSKSNNKNW